MTQCPQLTTRTAGDPFITKDNLYELIPSTYNRSPGTSVTVKCADGVSLVGEATFSCGSNGVWSYQTKPYCTATVPEQTEEDGGTMDILIGIVCGIAVLIIAVLIVMLIVVHRREKQFRKSQKSARSLTTFSGFDHGEPPAPYNQYSREPNSFSRGTTGSPKGPGNPRVHGRYYDRDAEHYRDRHRGREMYRGRDVELDSQLSNSMYLPPLDTPRDSPRDTPRDTAEERRNYHSNENEAPMFFTGLKRPQLKSWISRGPVYGNNYKRGGHPDDEYLRHDPFLWRNSVLY